MGSPTRSIRVCPKCCSDQIVKKNGLIKCLACRKKSRETATVWIVKGASVNGAKRITRIVDEDGYVLKQYYDNTRFKGGGRFEKV